MSVSTSAATSLTINQGSRGGASSAANRPIGSGDAGSAAGPVVFSKGDVELKFSPEAEAYQNVLANGGAEEMLAYHEAQQGYFLRLADFTRMSLGIDAGAGFSLSGKLNDVIRAAAAKVGIVPPEKPASVKAMEALRGDPVGETATTDQSGISSLIVYMSDKEGGGDFQIWLDDAQIEQLLQSSAKEVDSGLQDLLARNDASLAANEKMLQGLFGSYMQRDGRLEWMNPSQRLGFFTGQSAEPALMVQTSSKAADRFSEARQQHVLSGLMRLMKAAQ